MPDNLPIIPGKCLICSTPNASIHFGIDACRACASFFKRAQLSGNRYVCRRGDHKCEVLKENGSMCRGCRYDKCVAIGMIYDGPKRKYYPKLNDEVSCSTSPEEEKESLLDRIAKEHALYVERRRGQELELIKKHNLVRFPHPSEELYIATFDFVVATFNVNLFESWHFFQAVFPSIKKLLYEDQRELFRMCMPQFVLAECFNRTKRIWGGFSGYSMCSVLGCHNLQPELFMGHQIDGPMSEELRESIQSYIEDQMTMVVPSFEKANICERELHALLALLLCEADLQGHSAENYKAFLDGVRTQIFEDLKHFYTKEMALNEYSSRLGTLLTLCHTFHESNTMFQEFFRMQVKVFDVYTTEKLLNELLL